MNEKIGIFGCTADPFTLAHREIVKQVLKQNVVNAVVIVPTIVDWHRAGKTKWLGSEQKMTVAKALTKGLGLVYVDDTELCLKERCAGNPDLEAHAVRNWHFVDTLVRIVLNRATDNQEFWPIVGSDELLNFKNWFAWRDILKLSDGIIAVVGRSGSGFDEKKFLKENPEFNGKLKRLTEEKGVAFVDLYPLYARDGEIDPEVTGDGLHLYPEAYGPWAEKIAEYIP